MTPTRELRVLVPVEVLNLARRRLAEGETVSEAVRRTLARIAGVDPADYPVRPGRPWDGVSAEDRRAATEAARQAKAAATAAQASGDRVPA
jgi:hypothetical protein